MGIPRIIIDEDQDIYCYNLDNNFKCMAFNQMRCTEKCPARVGSLYQLKTLYESLISYCREEALRLYGDKLVEINIKLNSPKFKREQEKQIIAAYNSDRHRGSKGGSSESDSNSRASIKQRMKDNRAQECRPTKTQRDEIKALTEEWEAENGKLPRLSRSMLSRGEKK